MSQLLPVIVIIFLVLIQSTATESESLADSSCSANEGGIVTECDIYQLIHKIEEKLKKVTSAIVSSDEESSAEETSAEESSVEETSAEESSVEETSAEESSAEEIDFDSIQDKLQKCEKLRQDFESFKENITNEFGQFQESMDQQLGEFKKEIELVIEEAASASAQSSATDECISDIKFSEKELRQVNGTTGFFDYAEDGYVITSVANHDKDGVLDHISRRVILMKRGEEWIPLHV